MIHTYLDVIDRSRSGPRISKADWDMDMVVLTTKRLVKKYGLSWDKEKIVPNDPDLADRIFQAALELAELSGAWCASTERVIRFDRDELWQGMRRAPQALVMGEGKDARTLLARKVMDDRPPMVWAGNPGVPTPEEIFQPMVMSWMQEPIVDLVTCGSLPGVAGRPVETGGPLEIYAVRRELAICATG